MKHIFFIHSWITYIISISTIEDLALQHDDVVFLYGRGFTHQDHLDIETVFLPTPLMALSKVPSYGERFLLFKRWSQIFAVDRLINKLAQGNQFIAYLPLSKNFLMQLIATHPKCCDVVFLEEGLLSYTGKFNKKTYGRFVKGWRGKLAALIRYPNHGYRSFFYRPYSYSRPLPIYMLHAAPDIVDSNVEVRVLKSIIVPPVAPQFRLKGGYLLVVDTVVEDGITSQENYLRVLESGIAELLKEKSGSIWVRFRPNHSPSKEIVALLEKHFREVMILSDEICMESVFYYSENLAVIGLHSSLLFYAAIWGHKSFSLLERLFEIDDQAEKHYRTYLHLPSVFYEKVDLL